MQQVLPSDDGEMGKPGRSTPTRRWRQERRCREGARYTAWGPRAARRHSIPSQSPLALDPQTAACARHRPPPHLGIDTAATAQHGGQDRGILAAGCAERLQHARHEGMASLCGG